MILSVTDFGWRGPYLGEMRAAALREAPGVPYVDLMADAPAFRPDLTAYLLAALAQRFTKDDVVLAVVDPGVGSERAPLALELDGVWFVGPDNGLFEIVLRRAGTARAHVITWRAERLSASFHGRDLFAPMAARLALGQRAGLEEVLTSRFADWPDELDCVVHIDAYGNLISGRRATSLDPAATLDVRGMAVRPARTFADVPHGCLFWYANSSGLVEIAMNGGDAAGRLGLAIGASLRLQP